MWVVAAPGHQGSHSWRWQWCISWSRICHKSSPRQFCTTETMKQCGQKLWSLLNLLDSYPVTNIGEYPDLGMEGVWCNQTEAVRFLPIYKEALADTNKLNIHQPLSLHLKVTEKKLLSGWLWQFLIRILRLGFVSTHMRHAHSKESPPDLKLCFETFYSQWRCSPDRISWSWWPPSCRGWAAPAWPPAPPSRTRRPGRGRGGWGRWGSRPAGGNRTVSWVTKLLTTL